MHDAAVRAGAAGLADQDIELRGRRTDDASRYEGCKGLNTGPQSAFPSLSMEIGSEGRKRFVEYQGPEEAYRWWCVLRCRCALRNLKALENSVLGWPQVT